MLWKVVKFIVVCGFDAGFESQAFYFNDAAVVGLIPCSHCTAIRFQESKM